MSIKSENIFVHTFIFLRSVSKQLIVVRFQLLLMFDSSHDSECRFLRKMHLDIFILLNMGFIIIERLNFIDNIYV